MLRNALGLSSRQWWNKRKSVAEIAGADWVNQLVHGSVEPGWEAVRDEFIQNFRARGELGAAACVYFRGEKVVDLWGGYRTLGNGGESTAPPAPWKEDTLVNIFSTTKGISALALAMQHSRGGIDYDEKVCKYWPEFAQNGKESVTVREVIDHATGIGGPSPPITLEMLRDRDATNSFLAATKMEWPVPGHKKGYMAILVGNYISSLIQMTTETNQTVGEYVREEMCRPLQIEDELFIGLPKEVPDNRLAELDARQALENLLIDTFPKDLMQKMLFQPWTYTARSFRNPRLSLMPSMTNFNSRAVREVEMPGANGHATSRALAQVYSAAERAINTNGLANPLGFSKESLDELMKPAKPSHLTGWYDEVLLMECPLALGMLKPGPENAEGGRFCNFGSMKAFGTPGAGGSFAFCDPVSEIAFAYTMNRCGSFVFEDPREFAIRTKVFECTQKIRMKDEMKPLPLDRLTTPHFLTQREIKRYPFLAPLARDGL